MNAFKYLALLATIVFAPVALAAAQPQKPAPAEPDFFAANGAQVTIGGKQYTIKVGAAAANGKRDVTVTSPTNGLKSYKSNPNQPNRPVNRHKDGIQVFVGTDQRDVIVPAGQANWNGLSVVMLGLGGDPHASQRITKVGHATGKFQPVSGGSSGRLKPDGSSVRLPGQSTRSGGSNSTGIRKSVPAGSGNTSSVRKPITKPGTGVSKPGTSVRMPGNSVKLPPVKKPGDSQRG